MSSTPLSQNPAELSAELHTLRDFVRWGASRFGEHTLYFGHGTDNAIDEAMTLVLHALHLNPGLPNELWAARLTTPEKQTILQLFQQRLEQRVPTPYLTHEAWFAGLRFYVDQRVLIPRSPLAELIEQGFEPWLDTNQVERVLELGTGSACIAIATALALPETQVDAVDISEEALAVAQRNIADYGLNERVHAFHGDLFAPLADTRYDLILCNPPYVDAAEMAALPPEYRHEPTLALAAGEDGLVVVHRILADASAHLRPEGVLIVEVGASQPALIAAYPDLDFTWLDFARGGSGVFLLTEPQLRAFFEENTNDA